MRLRTISTWALAVASLVAAAWPSDRALPPENPGRVPTDAQPLGPDRAPVRHARTILFRLAPTRTTGPRWSRPPGAGRPMSSRS